MDTLTEERSAQRVATLARQAGDVGEEAEALRYATLSLDGLNEPATAIGALAAAAEVLDRRPMCSKPIG
jgi:hypothetical protein